MRTADWIAALALLGATVHAQDREPTRTSKTGEIRDTFWNFTWRDPGLEDKILLASHDRIVEAKTKDGLLLRVRIYESETPRSADEWRKEFLAGWRTKKRELRDLEQTRDLVFFRETKYGAMQAEHAYRFVARGAQCFVVHAWIDDRTGTSAKRLRKVVAAFRLADDPGSGLRVVDAALRRGVGLTHKRALLEGGVAYMQEGARGLAIPTLAAQVLDRAHATKGELDDASLWALHFHRGTAHAALDKLEAAIPALALAEKHGQPHQKAAAAWEHARCLSRKGDLDGAFAALDRAFAGDPPVNELTLSKDKALRPLREDPRWEAFWKKRVSK